MPAVRNLVGERFGRLVAITRSGKQTWKFACDCGAVTEKRTSDVTTGRTRSCGCLLRETTTARLTRHGMADTPEYHAWQAMINRCTNPNYEHFHCYGGRGITVAAEWLNFTAFYAYMGARPSPRHSIDRIDNNGHYEPSNCRWATKTEQMRNLRKNVFIEYEGKRQTIAEWARELGLSHATIWSRVNAGHTTDRVLASGALHHRFVEFDGKRLTLTQWAKEIGLSVQALSNRLNVYGWTVERALRQRAR